MSYKERGTKAKYVNRLGYMPITYTIYCALESVFDHYTYIMVNDENKEQILEPRVSGDGWVESGCHSLIDVLYCLKHEDVGTHSINGSPNLIVIEEMTDEEMNKYFRNR